MQSAQPRPTSRAEARRYSVSLSLSDEHWICELNKDPRTYHFISTYKDNPFLEQKVIDEIESLKNKNSSLWQIYGLGLQTQVEGLVFRNVDVVERIPETGYRRRRFVGVDFGYTNDPTAIVAVQIRQTPHSKSRKV